MSLSCRIIAGSKRIKHNEVCIKHESVLIHQDSDLWLVVINGMLKHGWKYLTWVFWNFSCEVTLPKWNVFILNAHKTLVKSKHDIQVSYTEKKNGIFLGSILSSMYNLLKE